MTQLAPPDVRSSNRVERLIDADRPPVFAGLLGGAIGAVCCVGPAVGVAVGASSGSFLIGLSRYRPVTFALGVLFAAGAVWLQLRKRERSCATPGSFRALRGRWIDMALVVFVITYALGRFVVPPLIERL
jgi:hypothetical protein